MLRTDKANAERFMEAWGDKEFTDWMDSDSFMWRLDTRQTIIRLYDAWCAGRDALSLEQKINEDPVYD